MIPDRTPSRMISGLVVGVAAVAVAGKLRVVAP